MSTAADLTTAAADGPRRQARLGDFFPRTCEEDKRRRSPQLLLFPGREEDGPDSARGDDRQLSDCLSQVFAAGCFGGRCDSFGLADLTASVSVSSGSSVSSEDGPDAAAAAAGEDFVHFTGFCSPSRFSNAVTSGLSVEVSPRRSQQPELPGSRQAARSRCDDDRELFVGNLAAEVTSEDLVRVFSEFGPVRSVGVAKDAAGACKGFGFLAFQRPELAEQVLESPRLFTLYGRVLRVDWRLRGGTRPDCDVGSPFFCRQRPEHRLLQAPPASNASQDEDDLPASRGEPSRQLFVGNLASDVTQGDLRQYFRKWGELLYCYVIRDEDGQSKRYGFITFKDPRVAEQLMHSRSSHVLKGKRLRFEMPKRSREEAFNLRHEPGASDAGSSGDEAASVKADDAPTSPASPKDSPPLAAVLDASAVELPSAEDRLPLWLHMRLMSDKEQLILCLRKELGLCSLLAERRLRELGLARDRESQMLRAYAAQLETRVGLLTSELETLREQLGCRGEQVKLLTAKVETLALEVVKGWGSAGAANGGSDADTTAVSGAFQQQQLHHQLHRLRPDSGIGL